METLVKQKSLLTQCQQREFEAYIQVKKSVETVEQAQLEKAEVCCRKRYTVCTERKRERQMSYLNLFNFVQTRCPFIVGLSMSG